MPIRFRQDFDARHGEPVSVAPGIQRLTAPNPGPFTFAGTNTYLVGGREVAVIDPGPDNPAHLAALRRALAGRTVSHILVSHTHRDHSPLTGALKRETGATVLAQGPHPRPTKGTAGGLDASADTLFVPDRTVVDGELVSGSGWSLRVVLTPGHTANHACFTLEDESILFSGDHVMAWATTVVAPPEGNMADYLQSLDRLLARSDRVLFPGHGGPVRNPKTFMRSLKTHRRMREKAILARLRAGERVIPSIVAALYRDIDPRLHAAAALVVLAHLEHLVAQGLVRCSGAPALDGRYAPA